MKEKYQYNALFTIDQENWIVFPFFQQFSSTQTNKNFTKSYEFLGKGREIFSHYFLRVFQKLEEKGIAISDLPSKICKHD